MSNKLILAGKILVPFILVIASVIYLVGKFQDYKDHLSNEFATSSIQSHHKTREENGSKFVLLAQESIKQSAESQNIVVVGFGQSTTDMDNTILRGEVKIQEGNRVVLGNYCVMKNALGQAKRVNYDICKMFWALAD